MTKTPALSRTKLPPAPALSPQVAYHAEERALVRAVRLRALTALEAMYAYWGSDCA